MKIFGKLILFVFLVMAVSPLYAQVGDLKSKVELKKLNDHLYQITTHGFFDVELIASVGPDGILLVDTGLEQTAKQLKKTLKDLNQGKLKYIINTHEHNDHTGGNKVLGREVDIIAHEKVKHELKVGYNILRELPDFALPNKTITAPMSLQFNGEEIKIIPVPGSHSDTDTIVYFTKSKIVYMGGVGHAKNFPFPDTTKGGDVKNYPDVIQKIIDAVPDDVTFIPGHGESYTKADLKEFHEMLIKTIKLVKQELKAGKKPKELQQAKILKKWDSYGQGFVKTDAWIKVITDRFTGKTKTPKKFLIEPLYHALKKNNIKGVLTEYKQLKEKHKAEYDFSENVLNLLGYHLLGQKKIDQAIEIFKFNIEEYPESYNVYDSLGEAYMIKGEKKLAIEYYQKALQINPEFENSKKMLKKLEKK
ncbi:MBL fold metallo-hydrolase [candidate division CSSED10-310 bacterium]|uniref:MBL fold metallo-hydrolase n=1 Tax=candidate division CSSED10-310 bacterium TaxID=2855610 RepID=A0ABV6Z5K0_UNCC1